MTQQTEKEMVVLIHSHCQILCLHQGFSCAHRFRPAQPPPHVVGHTNGVIPLVKSLYGLCARKRGEPVPMGRPSHMGLQRMLYYSYFAQHCFLRRYIKRLTKRADGTFKNALHTKRTQPDSITQV